MTLFAQHYPQHIQQLRQNIDQILVKLGLTGVVIHSGQHLRQFLDDMDYPFKVNPHFKHWLPVVDNPNCYLLVKVGEKPTLLFYRPEDFWHAVPPVPTAYWTKEFELVTFERVAQVTNLLPSERSGLAYIGSHSDHAAELGLGQVNPQPLMDYLHFHRSCKTDYEIACIAEANRIAVLGHQAAEQAFRAGQSEFGITQAYIAATEQGENELPYSNIVALNDHSAILHYTKADRQPPQSHLSFLIDAGASCNGYASDITRTYAQDPNSRFGQLIAAMNQAQLAIIALIKPGLSYTELHDLMHHKIAELMVRFELVHGSAEQAYDLGITRAFFPHGLGHPIGLQVHDVAGFMQDETGTHLAPPKQYPALRCTRVLTEGMVLTIEPGIYVIDSLINDLDEEAQALLNHAVIDELRPYGGIRIEDNLVVTSQGCRNLTRDLGLN